MTPILALNFRGGTNVTRAKGMGRSCQQDNAYGTEKEDI